MLLAGDIGGTKTNLAIYSRETGPQHPLVEATFPSRGYPNLEALATEFLSQVAYGVDHASFGVAGPVHRGRAETTNLPWAMDETQLARTLNLSSVRLLNDLAAIAHAVPFLGPDDLVTLNAGQPDAGGTIAVIAPGTGLGQAFLTWDGARYRAYASEGGHADFAPTTPIELELLTYLLKRFDHVSYERVCSGRGIPNLYAFLKDSGRGKEPAWLTKALAEAQDPTPVIVNNALDRERPCELCSQTLDLFVSILATEAGNLALELFATGGVYMGGGIPPRILPALQDEGFTQAFRSKGRLTEMMDQFPVHVIRNPKVALLGAACYGLQTIPAAWQAVGEEA